MPKKDNVRLHVISREPGMGNHAKAPVLLVHGAWHGAWCWEGNFLDYFAKAGHPAYALDLRGHGHSAAPTAMRWNRILDYVDDVEVTARNFDQPPFVIGHSMGGFVCQHLASRDVALSGIGLLSTVPSYGACKVTANIAFHRPLDFLKANLTMSLYPLVADAAKARHMFINDDVPQEKADSFAARLGDESYMAFLDMLLLAIPERKPTGLPMYIVGGGRDRLFGPESQFHTARIHGCDCSIVEEAPHDGMLSSSWREQAKLFLAWMDKTGRRQQADKR